MKNFRRILTLVLALAMTVGIFSIASADEAKKSIVIAIAAESGTLDPAGISSTHYWNYSSLALAPLVELAPDGSYDFITAESCDTNEDMSEFTFHLRPEAKWSDGSDCTSYDYLNTITRALDPACGSGYSDMLFVIKGAKDIYDGTADMSALGVTTPDEKTIVFSLTAPCPYFLDLFSLPVYMPSNVNYATETNGDWCFDPATSLSNSAFYMKEYVPEQYILLEKNPYYCQADRISLDEIKLLCIADTQSTIYAYKTGEVDYASADYTVLGDYEGKDDLKMLPSITTWYTLLNWDVAPLDDVRVREALTIGVNRAAICASAGSDTEPTTFFVAKYLVSKATGKYWGDEVDPLFEENVARAQELLAEAGYPNGEGFPELTFKYPNLEIEASIAQSLQAQWKENLGITVNLEAQEYQVNISDRRNRDFDICRMRWTADFADPTTYLSMYMDDAAYNDNNTASAKYNELMAQANVETDMATRFQLLHDAEHALIGEDFAFIPILAKQNITLINPKISNFVVDPSRNGYRWKYMDIAVD